MGKRATIIKAVQRDPERFIQRSRHHSALLAKAAVVLLSGEVRVIGAYGIRLSHHNLVRSVLRDMGYTIAR